MDAALLRARTENTAALAANAEALAILPPAHLVYAGTVHTGTGNFRGTGGNGGAHGRCPFSPPRTGAGKRLSRGASGHTQRGE